MSGHERNHLFLSKKAKQFKDVSAISGLDHPADARSFALLDYDRDGWLDIAVVNANAPLLQVFRNRIGSLSDADKGNFVALRLVGGNHSDGATTQWSNRNGYGAAIKVLLDDGSTLVREHRCGEGFAAQNRSVIHVGIGQHEGAKSISVRWPSGMEEVVPYEVPHGSLVTIYEDAGQAKDGKGFLIEPYVKESIPSIAKHEKKDRRLALSKVGEDAEYRVLIAMATTCVACKKAYPQVAELCEQFADQGVAVLGIPVDEEDTPDALQEYVADQKPPYAVQVGMSEKDVTSIKSFLKESLEMEALPSTIVTDREGRVLTAMLGVPSISEIRKALTKVRRNHHHEQNDN